MDFCNGIPISEWKLVVYIIMAVVILIALVASAALLLHMNLGGADKKKRARIKKLKAMAETDELAKKKLEKIERKARRKRERNKQSIIYSMILWIIIAVGIVVTFVIGIIPPCMDYAVKDYAVYTGGFEIHRVTGYKFRRTYIVLDDGTQITGTAGLDADATHGTVVYAKRSKVALGAVE